MEGIFFTLQDFFAHTKSITYQLLVPALLGFIGFWIFLTGKDEEE